MATKRKEWLQIGSGKSYFHRTHQPLQCLIFITPLLLIYQIGTAIHPLEANQQGPIHVVAFLLMLKFFSFFGAAGNYLPLLAVIAMLMAWHLARKDKWDFMPQLYAGMAAESVLWAVPIFVITLALLTHFMHGAATAAAGLAETLPPETAVVLSIGAGIYEELLFRLVAITILNIIFVDMLEMKVAKAIPIIILISALLFASYHMLGKTAVTLPYFFFLAAFGVYCAGIFIFRGFGIVVGCHAVYDLIVVMNDVYHHR